MFGRSVLVDSKGFARMIDKVDSDDFLGLRKREGEKEGRERSLLLWFKLLSIFFLGSWAYTILIGVV